MSSGFTHENSESLSVEWYTPKSVFDGLGATFDMDVCSPGIDLTWVPTGRCLTPEDDGLTTPWEGLVWCNPPYGRGIEKWLQRCADHGNSLALVPARTDTAWFREAAKTCNVMLFMKGRVKFHPGDKYAPNSGSPGAGNVFLAWGHKATTILKDADLDGTLVRPVRYE